MSNILLVLCHPLENSLNWSIAESIYNTLLSQNKTIECTNLYKENYHPNTITDEYIQIQCSKISKADVVIFQFPMYFGGFPALLQDWLMRVVLATNISLESKQILISLTTGASRSDYSLGGSRLSLEDALFPLLSLVFSSRNATLLQPFVIFSCNSPDTSLISSRILYLQSKLLDLSQWPCKSHRLEEGD